jgi:replicative DNA helicase
VKKQQNSVNASTEAEQAVLGGLMLSNDAWLAIADVVTAEHFSRPDHRLIFGAIAMLANERRPFDPVTVSEILDRQKTLREAGGLQYLGSLTKETPGAANARAYAKIVYDRWKTRKAGEIAGELQAAAAQGDDLVDSTVQRLMALSHVATVDDGLLATSIGAFIDDLDARSRPDAIPRIQSGIGRLDSKLGGFAKSDLIVIAGRPSMGKTALALNVVAANHDRAGGMISGEQPRMQLIPRLASIMTGIDGTAMRTAKLQDEDWVTITKAMKQLQDLRLYVNDHPAPHSDRIVRQARKWKHYHNIEYLVSDYLQRFDGPGRERHSQIEAITRAHKEIARELDIPVFLLCQIGRGVEARQDKRPTMADLRDSGAIEQEADVILTLYRDEVYYGPTPGRDGEIEIAALKNRHGPLGVVGCKFNAQCVRFEDFDFGQRDDPGPSDDLQFDRPSGRNGAHERSVEDRRGPYRRSKVGG